MFTNKLIYVIIHMKLIFIIKLYWDGIMSQFSKKLVSFLLLLVMFFSSIIVKTFASNDGKDFSSIYNKDTKIELVSKTKDYSVYYDKFSRVHYLVFLTENITENEKIK